MTDPREAEALVVLTSANDAQGAESLARGLVTRRVAACVNIVPGIRSIYHWQGTICDEAEVLLVIKTTADQYPSLEEALVELHAYDVPEIVALPASEVHGPYARWLREVLSG